jgi:hypothetical protein
MNTGGAAPGGGQQPSGLIGGGGQQPSGGIGGGGQHPFGGNGSGGFSFRLTQHTPCHIQTRCEVSVCCPWFWFSVNVARAPYCLSHIIICFDRGRLLRLASRRSCLSALALALTRSTVSLCFLWSGQHIFEIWSNSRIRRLRRFPFNSGHKRHRTRRMTDVGAALWKACFTLNGKLASGVRRRSKSYDWPDYFRS